MTDAASASAASVASSPTWLALVGKMAPISSIVLYMAPVPTILGMTKRKSVGNLPLLPYTSMISNAFIWVVYGLLVDEPKLWIANTVGFILGAIYCLSFIRIAPKGMKSSTLPGSISLHIELFLVVAATVLFFAKAKKSLPIGQIGVMINLAMYASPLAAVKTVLDSKSSESIPLPLTVASFLSCVFWSLTGYLDMKDPYVYSPAMLGIVFGLMQISLKLAFEDKSITANPLSPDLNSAEMKLS